MKNDVFVGRVFFVVALILSICIVAGIGAYESDKKQKENQTEVKPYTSTLVQESGFSIESTN